MACATRSSHASSFGALAYAASTTLRESARPTPKPYPMWVPHACVTYRQFLGAKQP